MYRKIINQFPIHQVYFIPLFNPGEEYLLNNKIPSFPLLHSPFFSLDMNILWKYLYIILCIETTLNPGISAKLNAISYNFVFVQQLFP